MRNPLARAFIQIHTDTVQRESSLLFPHILHLQIKTIITSRVLKLALIWLTSHFTSNLYALWTRFNVDKCTNISEPNKCKLLIKATETI